MLNVSGLAGVLGMSPVHLFAYGTMTVLGINAAVHLGTVLLLRRRFRRMVMPATRPGGSYRASARQQCTDWSNKVVVDPELAEAVKNARASGSLLPLESALLRIFDPVISGCERGLFYCPSFGLFFTVIGALLAILSAVGINGGSKVYH